MTNSPPISRDDPAWRTLKSWLITQIHAEQRALEVVGMPDALANAARGRIEAHRGLIKAVEPEKLIAADQIDDGRDYFDN